MRKGYVRKRDREKLKAAWDSQPHGAAGGGGASGPSGVIFSNSRLSGLDSLSIRVDHLTREVSELKDRARFDLSHYVPF